MIDRLISFSIHNKLVVGIFVLALIGWGIYSFTKIPIDAVPDITTNQVQVITQSPKLATQEVEQFVTFPVETALANLPEVTEIRSISRFGISVVTIVFEEHTDIYRARQLISEQLKIAESDIPEGFGKPELGPITTGLGEIYQYVLHKAPGYEDTYSDMDLRTINDWIVKRQLSGTPGVIEVSGWGGHLKQYEVAVNPEKLKSMHITIADVFSALESNNENTGGSYIEKHYNTYFIRGEGLVKTLDDIERIVVKTVNGIPLLIRDIAEVGYGSAPRYGAITYNAQGEVVGGQALMLKGENSYEVVKEIKKRIETIKQSLPEGVILQPFLERSELIDRAMHTVTKNLIEGGLIVILILILLLGNFRGGIIVASVIPLAMLFAMGMMNAFGVSANLMSLGAIDFGLVVDGSVIIVEAIIYRLSYKFSGQKLSSKQMNKQVNKAASRIRSSAAFGEIIILIVYLPILALVGIEGKMFKPMAQTVSFAIAGALILSMTYVPMMSALFLKKNISNKRSLSDRIIEKLHQWYEPALAISMRNKLTVLMIALALFLSSMITYNRLGGEFIPTLEEGDFALHQILPPGSSLQQSVEVSEKIQRVLLDSFPEVDLVISKIGTAEIATDPMPIEVGDIIVKMKPKKEWQSASNRDEMFEKMEVALNQIPGVTYEFTQPIQMRFNELIAGAREDIAIKLFGENPDLLYKKAKQAEAIIKNIKGVGDLKVEQTQGLPQMIVSYERNKIAQYGLNIKDLNMTLRTAFAGETAGVVFENERRFDLSVRLEKKYRQDIDNIRNLYVPLPNGEQIPLKEVAKIEFKEGPMQISREDAKRKIGIGVNARNRDIESLVEEISETLNAELDLPPGYYLDYGGQFENLVAAKKRLSIAVPVALLLIMILLFFTFNSISQALLIFTAIPLSAIGGIYALWLRDMPFSISAGVGFIALFGVAVLNGIVLISYFNQLKREGVTNMEERIKIGTKVRLRPVIMTASVAALGFLPMALSGTAGAEVQRPLATVVIGGLVTATLLTLLVLPVLYRIFDEMKWKHIKHKPKALFVFIAFAIALSSSGVQAQDGITIEQAIKTSKENHPLIKAAELNVEKQRKLKKTAFDLDKTNVTYTNGQLNSSEMDYQWQFTQNFQFPTTYISQSKLANKQLQLSEQALLITDLELEHKVRSAWWHVAYAKNKLTVINELLKTYEYFSSAAKKRYDAGEINILEKTNAESRYQQIILKQKQAETDLHIYKRTLQQWMGSDSVNDISVSTLQKINRDLNTKSNAGENPILKYHAKKAEITNQAFKVQYSGFLPDLSIGYFNQQIEGVEGNDGIQFGIGIPLFFWTQQGKVQAAKMNRKIAEYEYKNQLLKNESLHSSRQLEVAMYLEQVLWYEKQGIENSNTMIRFANKGYRAGEMDYVEYISNMEQAIQIKTEYLNILNEYNQAVLNLQFLNGTFN